MCIFLFGTRHTFPRVTAWQVRNRETMLNEVPGLTGQSVACQTLQLKIKKKKKAIQKLWSLNFVELLILGAPEFQVKEVLEGV